MVLLAAAGLVAAVLTLRGQVEPTAPSGEPAAAPSSQPTAAPAPGQLPVQPSRRELDWRRFPLQPGATMARAGEQYLTVLQAGGGQSPESELVVIRRDTAERVASYRTERGWLPVSWTPHHDGLLVLEHRETLGEPGGVEEAGSRLRWLEFGTGAVRELSLRSMPALEPHTAWPAGGEVLLAGITGPPARTCLIALRPADGTDRTLQCHSGHLQVLFNDTGDRVRWTYHSPESRVCDDWHELLGDGSAGTVPGFAGPCLAAPQALIGGWAVGTGPQWPSELAATGPSGERLILDESAYPGVACGREFYWISFTGQHPRVLRWRPGTDHTHVALSVSDGASLELHVECSEQVLTASVYLPSGDGSLAPQAWVLDEP